jgi:DNA-binding FadR family transcriptional regulator
MGPPGTFERVYVAIKEMLRRGAARPGERLEPAALSEQLYSSVTPIRDALHRLAGERLVDAPRQEGFRVPLVTETGLRHLYAWHHDLLLLAILRRNSSPRPVASGDETAEFAGAELSRRWLFQELARATGNPEHELALKSVCDRLEPFEQLESALLDAIEEESMRISQSIESGDRRQLRRSLVHYHRRRERIIPELVTLVQRA